MKVIKNATLYAPKFQGKKDILIEGTMIRKIEDHIDEYDNIPEVEKLDVNGKKVVPGYIDIHEHLTGGGGEKGPASRCPEAQAGILFRSGVTTVVGMLGTDGISRSLENLLVKARAFKEEGLTCYILTGAYGYPPVTLLGDPERDIMLIDEMIGVKTAASDHRSSNITGEELIRLGTQARRGGLLAGKAGFVTIHMGDGKMGLEPVFYAIENSDIPIQIFLPTHMGRNTRLFEDGLRYMEMGGFIDITASVSEEENQHAAELVLRGLNSKNGEDHVTLSSDGFGSCPRFNEKMECVGLTYSTPECIHRLLKILVQEHGVSLEKALKPLTVNPAKLLQISDKKGRIAPGAEADLIVYDDKLEIESVFAKGKTAVWEKKVFMKGTFEE